MFFATNKFVKIVAFNNQTKYFDYQPKVMAKASTLGINNKQTSMHVSMIEIAFPKANGKTHASWWQR
jgi:hypothetical protein